MNERWWIVLTDDGYKITNHPLRSTHPVRGPFPTYDDHSTGACRQTGRNGSILNTINRYVLHFQVSLDNFFSGHSTCLHVCRVTTASMARFDMSNFRASTR